MRIAYKGGKGSGNFGHQGRPGLVGGSGKGAWADFSQIALIENSQDAQSALADAMGEPEYSPELGELVNEELAKWLSDKGVRVKVPIHVLEDIIESGRLKNQFETGTSGGILSEETRSNVEQELMDIPKEGTDPKDRPIYGYLMDGAGPDGAAYFYGNVTLVLKPDVRDRTSYSMDDSLDNLENAYDGFDFPYAAVSWMNRPSWASGITTRNGVVEYRGYPVNTESAAQLSNVSPHNYVEAQIHGGVSLKDIAKIYINNVGRSWDYMANITTMLKAALPGIVVLEYYN